MIRLHCVSALTLLILLGACGDGAEPAADSGAGDAGRDSSTVCATSADCRNGTYCDGEETCAVGAVGADARGCVAGIPVACAVGETCNEETDACESCSIDDADGDGVSECDDDCDDTDAARFPGATEICDDDDEDCNNATYGALDVDVDGFTSDACCNGATCGPDCDDALPIVHPTASEACDGLDNDCNGLVDDAAARTWYLDSDRDGFGDTATTATTACAPIDYAPLGGDCNDANPSVNPGTSDVCNRVDDNCDGAVDEGVLETFHRDADGDGFGDPVGATIEACAAPSGYVSNYTDCDDTTGRRNPGLTEVCDDMPDNDCTATTFTFDSDRDGSDRLSCGGTDCDDTSAAIGPGLPELCDRLDNDCSSGGGVLLSEDVDGDGFAPTSAGCTGGALPRTDCDDSRGDVSPSAAEICDGRDDDCDGSTDENPEAAASCNRTGTTGSCVLGACTIAACTGSYANCDGIAGNGCEANLDTSTSSCGACGSACASGATCVGRACSCPAGQVVCAGACVDLRTDEAHCGACGAQCPTGATCAASTCECPFGWILCGGACVDPNTSVQHCGGCGQTCLGGSCAGGACECAGAMGTVCSGTCRDLSVDLDHCGACDQGCRAGSCAGGTCSCPPTRPTICDGTCTNTVDDRFRCGSCDRACGLDACVASDCDAVVQISSGYRHACARRASGRLFCWGDNDSGKIGDGTTTFRPTAVEVLPDAIDVSGTISNTCAVRVGGRVWCWGIGGGLGDGVGATSATPVQVVGVANAIAVSAGPNLSCALIADGSVWCWGWIGGMPQLIASLTGIVEIAAAQYTVCGRTSTGAVRCYGYDDQGQRGDGPTPHLADDPATNVVGLADAVELAAGLQHFCARRATGAVACWGAGGVGQLGDGRALLSANAPVAATITGAVAIAAGRTGMCAVTTADSLECWGQIATITSPFAAAPIVVGGGMLTVELAVGDGHVCALSTTGALECRGDDGDGQRGDGPGIPDAFSFSPLALP